MSIITVNEEKCIKCQLCIKECPSHVLEMGEEGPEEVKKSSCIACGHCVAICPTTAIDNSRTPLVNQVDIKESEILDENQAEQFLRIRRSIRTYKEKSVSREELTKLVNIARFAPTGSNMQGISFVIVEDKELIKKSIEITINLMEDSPLSDKFKKLISSYREEGIDVVLRGAPNLILAIADKKFSRGRENSIFSLAYLELYAPSLGLGSCWAGFFEVFALLKNSPMIKLFNIPEGKKITGAIMVGYPKYSYKRLVDRNPLDITFI